MISVSSSSTKSWYPFVDIDDGVSCVDQYVSELHVSIAGMQHDGATDSALCEIDVSEFYPVCVDDAKHFSKILPLSVALTQWLSWLLGNTCLYLFLRFFTHSL